jgi:SpoVK/Ycf46/Vps4 family AAA+-type ATPase
MATSEQLKALLESYSDSDEPRFLAIAMQLAAHEARQGHQKLAKELRDIIDSVKSKRNLGGVIAKTVPFVQPRGELSGLLSASYPKTQLSDMCLLPDVSSKLHRIIREHRQEHKLRAHGLVPRRKMLLLGPPGSGKTMTASAIAGEMDLPLFTIVLDVLITKFMGETAAKLRLVFDSIQQVRGVYLFDEFDAIGSKRMQSNDVGEIRRVLNSFLQFIEKDASSGIIVAATNHPELLDQALFRRFDDVIDFSLPNDELIRKALKTFLGALETSGMDWKAVTDAANGLSYSDINRACENATKEVILKDSKRIGTKDLLQALEERKSPLR